VDRYTSLEKRQMDIKEVDGKLYLKTDSFYPQHVFECGQCFNFNLEEDGSYTAVFLDKIINVDYKDGRVIFDNISLDDFYAYFYDYFDFGEDYQAIKSYISIDETLKKATEYGHGIRILNQEVFETIISFIISANNQIPRIKKAVRIISERYGTYIGDYKGRSYYSFPRPEDLAKADPKDLREYARVGFRDKRIVEASKMIASGFLDFEEDKKLQTDELRKKLIELPGVGPKVADCILLFAYHRRETFPVDVWIKRVMETLFIGEEVAKKEIASYADKYFGDYAGFVQQYLFYYGRENAIGK
jgi:N-glycosylase/DNA lyase